MVLEALQFATGLYNNCVMGGNEPLLKIEMADGTLYEPPPNWARALILKADGDREGFIRTFQKTVKHHYEQKTAPTKFGMNHHWEDEGKEGGSDDVVTLIRRMRSGVYELKDTYESHADLAPSVLYPHIRGVLMSLAMEEAGGGGSVVEIGDNEVVEYSDGKRTDYSSLKQYLQEQGG